MDDMGYGFIPNGWDPFLKKKRNRSEFARWFEGSTPLYPCKLFFSSNTLPETNIFASKNGGFQ